MDTALLWFFNFVVRVQDASMSVLQADFTLLQVALTFPALLRAFTAQGAFGW